MQSVQTIGNVVNTREPSYLNPGEMHAEMSSHKYPFAQVQIKEFFDNTSIESIVMGTSSGDRRSHMLYRSDNGVIYQVHFAYGQYSDAFYLTKEFIEFIFEGNENNCPTFENPAQLSEFAQEFYDEGTMFEPIPIPPSSST